MEKVLISACLLGLNTKYNGGNNILPRIEELKHKYILVPICPEVMGGLPIPRSPAEIINNKVINQNGEDVTKAYLSGTNIVMNILERENIKMAILKNNSPSCGSHMIYDGSFKNKRIKGMGLTAKKIKEKGILIYDEDTYIELLND